MKKILSVLLVLLMMFSLVACGNSSSGDDAVTDDGYAETPTYTLRFGHVLTEQDAFHQGFIEWAEAVYEATKGDLVIEVYPSGQLGSEEDVLEQIRQGANIGWMTDFARGGSYIPELGIVQLPGCLSSIAEADALIESPTYNKYVEQLADEFGLRALSYNWVQGARMLFTNHPGTTPSDFSDLLIRCPSSIFSTTATEATGAGSVAIAFGEVYNAIQTKVCDGCELAYSTAYNSKIHEVCDYAIETSHIYQLQLIAISEDWWQSLPAEYQQILQDECNKAGHNWSLVEEANQATAMQAMIDEGGMTVISADELDWDAFNANYAAAYEKLGLTELREKIYAEIGKEMP